MEFERLAVRYMSIDLDEWFYVFPFSSVRARSKGFRSKGLGEKI